MRGNPARLRCPAVSPRSIPAYAGEPRRRNILHICNMVYPRVCGGTRKRGLAAAGQSGLSPRMRGNPWLLDPPEPDFRSIPAYAGEPKTGVWPKGSQVVYPRVCGGTRSASDTAGNGNGLSPRMRGNRWRTSPSPAGGRSIPAYAGEPLLALKTPSHTPVYPRVCGGTRYRGRVGESLIGLSPRMRGNLAGAEWPTGPSGSIPAYAGEPIAPDGIDGGKMVYPRVCGGTIPCRRCPCSAMGLSPRMRGNPSSISSAICAHRSIPAYAGEPMIIALNDISHPVYPRVCGGTVAASFQFLHQCGLSPRMRGNRQRAVGQVRRQRSIPAYAGEPVCRHKSCISTRVYPRVCGGTPSCWSDSSRTRGLSPRMRGNLRRYARGLRRIRSIPAYAGEPATPAAINNCDRVYPRVCGGTAAASATTASVPGLSPRMRGNPGGSAPATIMPRSIPAYAGEPGGQVIV